jgi:low temperature requirement protein LtrA
LTDHADAPAAGLLRPRTPQGHARVTFVELFFDLVFVFAITQISHGLAHHLDAPGAAQAVVLFVALWCAWVNTTWVTNWVDPDRLPARLMLFAVMFAALQAAIVLPNAFGGSGLAFALAYVAMEVGRTAWMAWAIPAGQDALRRNFVRILVWVAAPAPFWILGALLPPGARLVAWTIAVGIWLAGPVVGFRVPRLGASSTRDWTVDGGHFAERCGLFIIIALGEGILVTGATAAAQPANATNIAAFATAFIGSVAMWWVYFHIGEGRGTRLIATHDDPGRIARLGYTYLHAPIVAGIVLAAVGDDILMKHPGDPAGVQQIAALVGGPALYLAGLAAFKRLSLGRVPLSHMVGLVLLGALAVLGGGLPVLAVALGVAATLVLVAAWEHVSLRGWRA